MGTSRLTRACVMGALVGFVPFLLVLWDFGVRPLRSATTSGVNADFFDIQARALFDGNLDVPPGSVGIEAFVVDGRHYLYFGPLPALLRMPVLAVTDRFDGRLTALSMLAGWVVLATALSALVGQIRRRLRGGAFVGRAEAFGVGAVVAVVLGGSSLVVLASQPWAFHEVYVWSTALTVASVWSMVVAWDDPSRRRALVTTALVLATMLTRLPAGWAMALSVIATGIWFVVVRAHRDGSTWRRSGWSLVAGGLTVIAIGTAVNWAKFGHVFRFPIGDQVWTQHSAHRRVVLGLNGGDLDGPQFVATTLLAYFRPDGVRFTAVFPFITAPASAPTVVGDVLFDETMRTPSIPAAMPLLFLLAVWGVVAVFRRRASAGAVALRLPLLGAIAMTAAVIGFGHIAPRYASDFVPLLAVAGIAGIVDVVARTSAAPRAVKRGLLAAVAVLAVYGVVANTAIGVVNARQSWRGDRLVELIEVQLAMSSVTGDPLDRSVREVDELPPNGRAGELAIVGDCAALYLGSGERHGSWIPVELRETRFRIDIADEGLRPGSTSVMWFAGYTLRRLRAQVNLDGELRLVLVGASPNRSGHWLTIAPGDTVTVKVRGDTAANRFVATASLAGSEKSSEVHLPMTEWNRQFRVVPIVPHLVVDDVARQIGLDIEVFPGPVPPLCDRLRP